MKRKKKKRMHLRSTCRWEFLKRHNVLSGRRAKKTKRRGGMKYLFWLSVRSEKNDFTSDHGRRIDQVLPLTKPLSASESLVVRRRKKERKKERNLLLFLPKHKHHLKIVDWKGGWIVWIGIEEQTLRLKETLQHRMNRRLCCRPLWLCWGIVLSLCSSSLSSLSFSSLLLFQLDLFEDETKRCFCTFCECP